MSHSVLPYLPNPKRVAPFEATVSLAAHQAAPTTVPGRSATTTTTGSTIQEHYYTKHVPSTPARSLKRRAISPSPPPPSSSSSSSSSSLSSLLSLASSPSPFSPASTTSTPPSPPLFQTSGYLCSAQTTPTPSPAPRRNPGSSEKARGLRPTSNQRITSDPAQVAGGSAKSAQDIDGKIEDLIKNPGNFGHKGKELGYVYVVPATHGNKNIIKIGFTTESTVEKRMKAIQGTCKSIKITTLRPELSPEHRQVKLFYKQVEKLAHRELENSRYNFDCWCKTQHKEYFEIDEKIGHMVVEKWARFCEQQPFTTEKPSTNDLKLKSEWYFYLNRFRERNHGRGEECEKKDDHFKRHQRWETFVASKRWCWYRYKLGLWWQNACGWQFWSLLLVMWLVTLTVIFKLPLWASIPLLATAGGIYREESARKPIL